MKPKHTPGPWYTIPYHYTLNEASQARVYGANNEPVVDDVNPSVVDAEFIVRACNSHYDMLAALEACLLRDDIADGELGDMLRATIAKAKGELK